LLSPGPLASSRYRLIERIFSDFYEYAQARDRSPLFLSPIACSLLYLKLFFLLAHERHAALILVFVPQFEYPSFLSLPPTPFPNPSSLSFFFPLPSAINPITVKTTPANVPNNASLSGSRWRGQLRVPLSPYSLSRVRLGLSSSMDLPLIWTPPVLAKKIFCPPFSFSIP